MLSTKTNKYIIALAVLVSLPLLAQHDEKVEIGEPINLKTEEMSPVENSPISTNIPGVAIDGYDPVAYFLENKAVKGNKEHVCDYNGTQWQFSSQENRDRFLANPEKYAPQFGGYCALSITHNEIVVSDPESFVIKDDKLYLYVNETGLNKDIEKKPITFKENTKKRKANWFKYQASF